MVYLSNARPTSRDRKRARQQKIAFVGLLILVAVLIWGIVEYATKPTAPPVSSEIEQP